MPINKDVLVTKKSIRKLDRIVTGLLLGGVIASIYGIKQRSQNAVEQGQTKTNPETETHSWFLKIIKMIIFGVKKTPVVEPKKGIFAKIISNFLKR